MMAESRNLDQPLCQGWLQYRQSEHSKRFEKRWFVLKRRILWHYRSQDESPADAEYILYIGFLINFEVPNTIVLRKEQATFYLKAESEVEYQKWSNALLETEFERLRASGEEWASREEFELRGLRIREVMRVRELRGLLIRELERKLDDESSTEDEMTDEKALEEERELRRLRIQELRRLRIQELRDLRIWDSERVQDDESSTEDEMTDEKELRRLRIQELERLQELRKQKESLIPSEILNMDAKAIEIYKKALKDGKEKVFNTRVMIIGPFGVGKTTLAKRLLKHEFKMEDTQSTNGIEIHIRKGTVDVSNKKWIFQKETEREFLNCYGRLSKILYSSWQKVDDEPVVETQISFQESDIKDLGESIKNMFSEPKSTDHEVVKTDRSVPNAMESKSTTSHSFTSSQTVTDLKEVIRCIQQNSTELQKNLSEISIWDFGGQYDFYSTHQAFLSHRAIYLLVTNITKGWKDTVEEDGCFLDDSGCNYMVTGDYIMFWMNTISTYGSEGNEENGPPVILIATHLDKLPVYQRQLEIDYFFDRIRAGLRYSQNSFRHLADDDFAIDNTIEDGRIDDLRNKIIEIASKQKYWGEEIPATWIVLEKSLAKSRSDGCKMLSFNEVVKINNSIIQPLSNEEEIKVFLKFQNNLGNLIYYEEEGLEDFIMLEPQWLINAFKCLITATRFCNKNQHSTCQWEMFMNEGALELELAENIWKRTDEENFHEHRHHLLKLMQKMDIISSPVHKSDKYGQHYKIVHYVPCILKKPADDKYLSKIFENWKQTPFFCHVFENNFLPPAVFHRLVSALIGQWSLACQGKKKLIFCGCAVFELEKGYRLVICMFSNVIQISIHEFGPERSELVGYCIKVRNFVKETLRKISSRYKQHLPWVECIKCRIGFPDFRSNRGLIKIEELLSSKRDVQCHDHENSPSHIVNTQQLLSCWFEDEDIQHGRESDAADVKEDGDSPKSNTLWILFDVVASALSKDEASSLGILMGLTKNEIDMIEKENPGIPFEQNFQILWKWYVKDNKCDHINILKETLSKMQKNDVATELSKFKMADFRYQCRFDGKKTITEKDCTIVSRDISREAYKLLRFLNLEQTKIDQIRLNHTGNHMKQIMTMLDEWKTKTNPACTRNELCSALKYVKREDVITSLEAVWAKSEEMS